MAATVRAIRPVNMRGVTPAVITDAKPTFEWVDPLSLWVEESYQRESSGERSLTMIRGIVATWKWAYTKPPICVRDGKGRLVVIDGQHTAIAAASHGGIPKIVVMIVEGADVKARADAFVNQNMNRLGLTPVHMHYARLAASEEIAVATDEACRLAGVEIVRSQPSQFAVGQTMAIGLISKMTSKIGVKRSAALMKVMVAAKRAPVSAEELRAVWFLATKPEYRDKVDLYDLTTLIRSKPSLEWRKLAMTRVTKSLRLTNALAQLWFERCQTLKRAAAS